MSDAEELASLRRLDELEARAAGAPKPTMPLADVAESFGSGVVRGAAETAMLPITAKRGLDNIGDWAFDKIDNGVRYLVGAQQLTPQEQQARHPDTLVDRIVNGGQDAVRSGMDSVLHKPETTPGKFAGTIGEFVAPGGVFGKTGKVATKLAEKIAPAIGERAAGSVGKVIAPNMGDVVIPAVASEGAGEATKGTKLEPWARVAGALAGNAATAVSRARESGPATAVANSGAKTLTPAEWDAVTARVDNQHGINVSVPQAIQQVTGGRTKIDALERVVDGTQRGGAISQPFYQAVPGQVDVAGKKILDQIAPEPTAPSNVGPQTQKVAQSVIDDERAALNQKEKPFYDKAETQSVSPEQAEVLKNDPIFQAELKAMRKDPYGAHLKDQSDDSIAVIGEVKKRLDDAANAASTAGRNNQSRQAGMSRDAARDAATEASPDYQTALNIGAEGRQSIIEPLQNSPIGQLAGTKDTMEAARTVLGKNAAPGSEHEVAKTVMRIGEKDPELASTLVRLGLADDFNKATTRLMNGQPNYGGGAKFAARVAGNPQDEANVGAALRTLPAKQRPVGPTGAPAPANLDPAAFSDFIDTLRATGARLPQNSATSFNNQALHELSTGNSSAQLAAALKSGGLSIPQQVMEAGKRIWLGKNVESLADMFTGGADGVAKMRAMAAKRAETPFRDAGKVGSAEALTQTRERKPLKLTITPADKK